MELVKTCMFCMSNRFTAVMRLETGEWVKQCGCGLYFLSPRMDEKERRAFYDSGEFEGKYRTAPIHADFVKSRAMMRYMKLRPYLKDVHSLLDIGCSEGVFLSMLPDRIEAVGIDPTAHKKEWIRGYFPEDMPNKKFDMITCFHVLEHTTDPESFLRAVPGYLDGLFVLEYPDIERLLKRQEPGKCFHQAHLYDFNENIVRALLERNGFTIEGIEYFSGENHSDKNVMVIARHGTA